jgi:hypothetical protein
MRFGNSADGNINKRKPSEEWKANENENSPKNRLTVGGFFIGSVIKAPNNLLAVWFCGDANH